MRTPIIIPRKDHEVYFIENHESGHCQENKIRKHIEKELTSLHPAQPDETVCDFSRGSTDGKNWIMITVMEKNIFSEYRIRYPGKKLTTVTSLLVSSPNFTSGQVYRSSDEEVVCSGKNGIPQSIPVPENGISYKSSEEYTYADLTAEYAKRRYKKAEVFPLRKFSDSGLYKKRNPVSAFISLCAIAVAITVLTVSAAHARNDIQTVSDTEEYIPAVQQEEETVIKPEMPDALKILTEITEITAQCGGIIDSYAYTESDVTRIRMNIHSCEASVLSDTLASLPYTAPAEIREITYRNGRPYFTITITITDSQYTQDKKRGFSDTGENFRILGQIRDLYTAGNSQIISERIPEGQESGEFDVHIPADTMVSVFSDFRKLLKTQRIHISALSAEPDVQTESIAVTCAYFPCDPAVPAETNRTGAIFPQVFGLQTVKKTEIKKTGAQISQKQTEPGYTKIGTVKLGGATVSYYRNKEGKMIMVEENSR